MGSMATWLKLIMLSVWQLCEVKNAEDEKDLDSNSDTASLAWPQYLCLVLIMQNNICLICSTIGTGISAVSV